MLKNNNQSAVRRISAKSMKQNRVRNLFTVLAIVLTTFMLTTVFSIGFSLTKNMNTMQIRQQGSRSQIFLACPTQEQIHQAKQCSMLGHAGVMISVAAGSPVNAEGDFEILLEYHDEENFKYNITPAVSPVTGTYPEGKNEIMMSSDALEALKIKNPQPGMEISLNVEGGMQKFILTGQFRDDTLRTSRYSCFVSKAFADSMGKTAERDGKLCMSAKTLMLRPLIGQLNENIRLSEGQDFEIAVDNSVNNWEVAVIVIFVCFIIVISGYLLIYNIMYISVNRDIRFYGLLKTIGATPEQIRKIVKRQAFRLSWVGIPLGILLGTLISFVAVPYAMDFAGGGTYAAMPTDISFNPFIYVGTVVFAMATVVLSCHKPAKMAGKISPVEALKYNGDSGGKLRARNTTGGGKLHKIAFRNVFREKRRAVLVFASLLMGTLALLVTQTFFGSLKIENYADYYVPDDYFIGTDVVSGEEIPTVDPSKVKAAEELAEKVKNVDGMEEVMLNRSADLKLLFDEDLFAPFLKEAEKDQEIMSGELVQEYKNDREGSYSAPVVEIDTRMMERYNQEAERKIDIEAFKRGDVCYIGYVENEEQAKQMEGKVITLIDPESGKRRSIEIGLCALRESRRLNISYHFTSLGAPGIVVVSRGVLDHFADTVYIDTIIGNCAPKKESQVTERVRELVQDSGCVPDISQLQIKSELLKEFKSSMMSMNILTVGISAVLILIGIINFINVMLTGIFTRRRELAVMESVGMTRKQVQKMLFFEGMYYSVVTVGLILTVGNSVLYYMSGMIKRAVDYAVFTYPWQLLAGVTAALLLICGLVPAFVYRVMARESVTERLRVAE